MSGTGPAAVRHADLPIGLADNAFSGGVCLGTGKLHPVVRQLAAADHPQHPVM